jgi:putative hydrolase of the HAD superfamily
MALGGVTVPTASASGSTSSIPGPSRLVTLDALGTLVHLDDPFERLAAELSIPYARAREALRAEMAYYREHHDIASDRAGLERLRDACTEVLRDALGGSPLDHGALRAALLAALRFRPYPEVPGVLRDLRAAGVVLVVVSNWDVSLHDVMEQTGLRALVDGVLTSAEVGEAKPGGAMFRAALDLAGARPAEALHAGDSIEHDVAGALAIGMRAVLVDRDGQAGTVPAGVSVVADLRGADPRAPYPSD